MKLKFTLTPILLVFAIAAGSQDLTGIWRGYFSSSSGLYREDVRQELYKYEVQIDQQANNGLNGVTYSYKSTIFYGKAAFRGIYTVQTKNLILKETNLQEVKIGDKSEPCLMTCYLEYSKIGKLEVLQGTFSSVNEKTKVDCGSGKVYLERVKESDFELEPFLLKKRPESTARKTTIIPPPVQQQKKVTIPNNNAQKDNTTKAPVKVNANKPAIKTAPKTNTTTKVVPPANSKTNNSKPPAKQNTTAQTKTADKKTNTTAKQDVKPVTTTTPPPAASTWKPDVTVSGRKTDTPLVKWEKPPATQGPIPKVLLERENNLVKTIYTNERVATVEIFDNGTIDNDTISLYHNNKLVISQAKLTYTPLRLKIDCSDESKRHELIMVAENLGEIPPNSALMVITAGKKRYEIFLVSNEQRNAKVVVEYRE
ncbi:MAG TPA: hypothetical protein DHW64_14560 [Chitinophagaceae bacterium]|nr:hypothetical protein [Chitinophagaceae bacterium]